MTYAMPILVRSRTEKGGPQIAGSGTGLLLGIGGSRYLVTASHVLDKYRKEYVRDAATLFMVGDASINPRNRSVSEDATTDLVVIDLKDIEIPSRPGDLPAPEFFLPDPWPGNDVAAGDRIFFGGWPGAYRSESEGGMLVFLGYDSILNVPVTGVSDHEFQVKFDRSKWTSNLVDGSTKPEDYVNDTRLGGHSGAPIFRLSPEGKRPDLVGFVKQDRADDAIVCAPVTKLRTNGTVKASSVGYMA